MIRSSSVLQTTACLALLLGCGAGGGTDDDGETPMVPSFLTPGGGGTAAVGAGGTSGAPVGAAPGGGTGTAGQGGSRATGTNPPSAGGTGQGGGSAMEGTGNVTNIPNATGGTGNAPGGNGAGGTEPDTDPDPGAGFVSVDVNGGASAAFACPTGVTFGDPLAGMGAIQSVTAPSGRFFAFIEGPMWIGSVNKLFFSDNAGGPERIWQISPPFTTPSVFLEGSGSNGLAVDSEDKLLVADQAMKRVTRLDPATGQVTQVIAPTGTYKPNDLVSRSDGNIYFTDPDTARGLYRVSPAGQLTGPFLPPTATNGPGAPNGVLLSPDENKLFVGDVQQRFVATFNLLADGAIDLPSGQVFVRTQGNTVDGMAMDCAGNLYAGTSNGIEVYSPQAVLLGTIPTGDSSSNATFGGPDRRTLFVTQRSTLKFVTLAVPGLPD